MSTPRKLKPDRGQQSLLAGLAQSETENRALLRGALAALGARQHVAYDLECLLMFIEEQDTTRTGCQAFSETLARRGRRADQKPITVRTLERRLATARQWGVLLSKWDHRGKRRHRINWELVRKLARGGNSPSTATQVAQNSAARHSAKVADYSANLAGHSAKVADPVNSKFLNKSFNNPPPSAPKVCRTQSAMVDGKFRLIYTAAGGGNFQAPEKCGGDRLVAELREIGLQAPDVLIKNARRRGLPPGMLTAALAHWKTQAPAWGPGALFTFVERAACSPIAGVRVDDPSFWPPPSALAKKLERAAVRSEISQRQAEERMRDEQRILHERRQIADREQRLGPTLDAMSDDEVFLLACDTMNFQQQQFFAKPLAERPIAHCTLRMMLLNQLDKNLLGKTSTEAPCPK